MAATDPTVHKDFDLAKWGGPYMSLRKRTDWCHILCRRTLAQYQPNAGEDTSLPPLPEEILIMQPLRRARIEGSTACIMRP